LKVRFWCSERKSIQLAQSEIVVQRADVFISAVKSFIATVLIRPIA